jgi:hypothetical protein
VRGGATSKAFGKEAQNYWFVPVVASTTGELHPESLRLLYDFARLKTDAAKQHAVANTLRSPLTPEQLCQRRGATFTRLRMEAQLYSLRAAATRLTGSTGLRPMPPHCYRDPAHGPGGGGRGFCPGSRRPRARVPIVAWAWDLRVMRLLCCGLPAPARRQCFAL